jgi:predicted deacetylase
VSAPVYILVRNDDLCALSDAAHERRVLEVFARHGVPMTVAVIPRLVEDPHRASGGVFHPLEENREIVDLLREAKAQGRVEVALHGDTHQTNRLRPGRGDVEPCEKDYPGIDRPWSPDQSVSPLGFSEFHGLSPAEQREKIEYGIASLERVLGFRPDSFIFPWNSWDAHSIALLKQHGFKWVPSENDEFPLDGINVIGGCVWDWEVYEGYRWFDELFACRMPVLAHFGIHSWVYRRQPAMLEWLDELLGDLTSTANVHFIRPQDLPRVAPDCARILALRWKMRRLQADIGVRIGRQLSAPRYYVLERSHYQRRILRLAAVRMALRLAGRSGLALGRAVVPARVADRLVAAG